MAAVLLALGLALAGAARAQSVATTVAVESAPGAVAVNPVTNRIYVANRDSASVTVIDGATNETVEWFGRIFLATRVAVGATPVALAVNPATNRIYVANEGSDTVTVIDGATRATTTVAVGSQPGALAVDPAANRIYVANAGSASLTVIDGTTNATTTVAVGTTPRAVAVHPETGRVFVANQGSDNATVVERDSLATTTVATGKGPRAIALDPVRNRAYVLNGDGDFVSTLHTMTAIDGTTLAATSVPAGFRAQGIAVNPVTGEILVVTNSGPTSPGQPGWLNLIDPQTYSRATVATGRGSLDVAVDAVANRIFVSNGGFTTEAGSVTVIDGTTRAATTLTTVPGPSRIAVNPVTHRAYAASPSGNQVVVIDGAPYPVTSAATGSNPRALAINPVTGKAFVANALANTVSVIDLATRAAATVPVGLTPVAVAVNPVDNRAYVANAGSANVTVIDGASLATSTLAAGLGPSGIAVDAATGTVYVANELANTVTVIDGASHAATAVNVGTAPRAIVVDAPRNTAWVANSGSGTVTAIDGATRATRTIAAGAFPVSIAVDTALGRVYAANRDANSVTVIDGPTGNVIDTFATGSRPVAVAVNPFTHRAYVANADSANVSVKIWDANPALLDPAIVATVPVGTGPSAVAVNPVANKAYVATDFALRVIDGDTNTVTSVDVGTIPGAIAVDATGNRACLVNPTGNAFTCAAEHDAKAVPLAVAIGSLPAHATTSATPGFTFTTSGSLAARRVHYQVDTWQGAWMQATGTAPTFTGTTATLAPGPHVLYAFATDGEDASLAGDSRAPLVSAVAAYAFTVVTTACTYAISPQALATGAGAASVTVTVATQDGCGWSAASNADWIRVRTPGGSGPGMVTLALDANLGNVARQGTVGIAGSTYTVMQAGSDAAPRLANIATRGRVQTGANVLIAGFTIGGAAPKKVLVTARGPSVAVLPAEVPQLLADPFLQLFSGATQVDFNDDWQSRPDWTDIPVNMRPGHAKEAAILATLAPGAYTAIVTGAGLTSGLALVEVFEVDSPATPLVNIATRGRVETGANVMIAGFTIYGSLPQTVLVTARGASLAPVVPPEEVPLLLADPFLRLYNAQGPHSENDDWQAQANWADIPPALRPASAKDAALLLTLPPGAYTAIVSGVGDTSGIAIAEVFAQ